MGKTDATKPTDFIYTLKILKIACGVDNLKMSDSGMWPYEMDLYAKNARETSGGLYASDPYEFTDADALKVLEDSYK